LKTIEKLKNSKDLSDLAVLLGYKPKSVSFILYKIKDNEKYTTFKIPKKTGGEREINAPISRLKSLQKRLADLLQDCFDEIYNTESHRRALSHGFRKDYSIITNAKNHTSKRYVFNVDLKNFFPSINFGRVQGFFIKSNDFLLNPKVATIIAQISCHNNELPQGSPASPVISNLIGHILDVKLVKIAKIARCRYSRYADDLSFSTREKEFPDQVAIKNSSGEWSPSIEIVKVIKQAGFEVNLDKVSMQFQLGRQVATGLVVNRKVNIAATYYRLSRAMCDSLFRRGEFYFGKEIRKESPEGESAKTPGRLNQLRGVLSYIYHVKKLHDEREIQDRWKAPTAIHNLYRRFLYFEKFHALSKPLVLCEGKTDSVYIKCAIKSLGADYPELINTSSVNVDYNIDFFKYSNMNMDLMQFSGGTGDMPAFIHHFDQRMRPFLCDGQKFPVIILVDNDKGSQEVFSKAKKITGIKVDGSENFYYLFRNLYLVVLPKKSGSSDVMIEDFFESSVTGMSIDGKSFNFDEKTFDPKKHCGKHVFAEKIIKANQKTIDFTGFKPILDRFVAVVADYNSKVSRT